MEAELSSLNAQFAIQEHLLFRAGSGGLPLVEVRNGHGTATIALQGGQVLAFQPHGAEPVLWISKRSYHEPGKAIRGGIPVCWPWFGPHPNEPQLPAHGFVRTVPWTVSSTAITGDNATEIRLELADDERTRALWPHPFRLELAVVVGPALRAELTVQNPGEQPFTYGGALHSYFTISDIANVAIHGLDGARYTDQLQPGSRFTQAGPVTISAETDRIYLDTTATCFVEDAGLRRRISVAKSGSRSTVVWNPWIAKAQRMQDFDDREYRSMVCVETTNATDDQVTVAPGEQRRLQAIIGVEPLDEPLQSAAPQH